MNDGAAKGDSRAAQVGALIRADILQGRLEPGSRLTFPELCKTYDASVGVLREALTHLVDRGIVLAANNVGFRVMGLSDDNFTGLAAVRASIEPQFMRRSVRDGSVQWEASIVATHHLLARAHLQGADGGLNSGWLEAHEAFHVALIAGADNYRMVEITARLRDEADLYAHWWFTPAQLEQIREPMAHEHAALLEAALARDVDRSERLLATHIEDGARSLSVAGNATINGRVSNLH